MGGIILNKLDKDIRDGIELLGEISESSALSAQDKSRIVAVRDEFQKRIDSIKLHLGIIGEFNAGKSSLLNSLFGRNIVATRSRPCTPVPIYIQDSEKERLQVNFDDASSQTVPLSEYSIYTTEDSAPQGVKNIGMFVNSPLLKDNNIALIDTPGINSNNPKHTEVTLSALKDMHAAILLIYSKQPGSKSTIEFLQQAANQVYKIFICVSKSDFLLQDQLERIVRELPVRLSRNSGLKIDKIWPIHIAEDGVGDDMKLFLQEIKSFMIGEWYQIISKDLSHTLVEYSVKASDLLSNRLGLHEKLFFEYMQSNPTDFSLIASILKTTFAERFDCEFPAGQFEKLVKNKAGSCCENIRAQLMNDLNPNGKVLGIIDKRTTKKEVDQACKNAMSIFLLGLRSHEHSLINKIKIYFADIEKLAMAQLSQIHGTFKDFNLIALQILQNDPGIINRAKMIRFKRWLIISGLALVGIILNFAIFSTISLFSVLAASFLILLLLLIPVCFYYYPRKADIYRLSNQRLQQMKTHEIPGFNLDLELFNEWIKQEDIIKTDLCLEGHILKRAFTYLKMPRAKHIYSKLVAKWESNINLYEKELLNTYQNLREKIVASSEKYIRSLPETYALVLDDAFNANMELSRKLETTMDHLKNYISRLDSLNIQISEHIGGIKFICSHCKQHLEADLDMGGVILECPSCKKQLQVPMSRKRNAVFA